MICLYGLW